MTSTVRMHNLTVSASVPTSEPDCWPVIVEVVLNNRSLYIKLKISLAEVQWTSIILQMTVTDINEMKADMFYCRANFLHTKWRRKSSEAKKNTRNL